MNTKSKMITTTAGVCFFLMSGMAFSQTKKPTDTASKEKEIEEVIVIGYGTQKKKDLTGAIDQVDAKAINNRPVANMGQALQGVLPNLKVTIPNGAPNARASLSVRGSSSLRRNSSGTFVVTEDSPYVLIDGVPGDLNLLNPEDVETVTMLKDAASAAIYGGRAAFGVLLITTKSGKKGRGQIGYSNSLQWSTPMAIPDILNAYDMQLAIINARKWTTGNGTVLPNDQLKLDKIKEFMDNRETAIPFFYPSGASNTGAIWVGDYNPFKMGLNKYAPMQKHNISFSGGGENVTFYSSVAYQNQKGIYKFNTDALEKFNGSLNVSANLNSWFKVDVRTQYNNETYTEPRNPSGKGGWWTAFSQEGGRNRNMPMIIPQGAKDLNGKDLSGMYADNILGFMDYGASTKNNIQSLLMTVSPKVTLAKGLTLNGDFSYLRGQTDKNEFVPVFNRLGGNMGGNMTNVTDQTNPSYVYRSNFQSQHFTYNIYGNYKFTIENDHNFDAIVGFNQELEKQNNFWGNVTNVNPSIPYLNGAQGVRTTGGGMDSYAVRGLFVRFTYDYQGKYLFQSNARYDGTSKFGEQRRFAYFPSFSAGWVISKENWAQNLGPVDFLKLRVNYGNIGNQNTSNWYTHILQYGSGFGNYLFDANQMYYVNPPGINSPSLTWENVESLGFGANVSLFKKLNIDFDWYQRTTSDILTSGAQYPILLGTSVPDQNDGVLRMKGWELSMSYRNTTIGGLGYNMRFTLSDATGKVLKYAGNPTNSLSQYYSGKNIGEIWGYETAGIFQSRDEIDKTPTYLNQPKTTYYPGDVYFKDLNGDGVISSGALTTNDHGDMKVIGNSTPRYQFGFTGSLDYKGFDFNLFIQGVAKRDAFIGDNNLFWGGGDTSGNYEVYNNSWTPERTNAFYPMYNRSGPAGMNRTTQTRYLQNVAYLRVKDVTLGYTFPSVWTEKIKMSKLRLFVSAYNLYDLKSKKLPDTFDPELLSSNYPLMKSYAFGIQANF